MRSEKGKKNTSVTFRPAVRSLVANSIARNSILPVTVSTVARVLHHIFSQVESTERARLPIKMRIEYDSKREEESSRLLRAGRCVVVARRV